MAQILQNLLTIVEGVIYTKDLYPLLREFLLLLNSGLLEDQTEMKYITNVQKRYHQGKRWWRI